MKKWNIWRELSLTIVVVFFCLFLSHHIKESQFSPHKITLYTLNECLTITTDIVISYLFRKWWPCLTDTLLSLPSPHLCPPAPCPDWISVVPAVDWSTLIGGFARWFFGLAPPPPGAGVRSQQPVVPCAPPSPSLHTRAHAQGTIKGWVFSIHTCSSVSSLCIKADISSKPLPCFCPY